MIRPNDLELGAVPMLSDPKKPWQVRYAVRLLWLTFAQIAISILLNLPQFYADEEIADDAILLTTLLGMLALLIPSLSHGRNWARVGVIVFTIFGIWIDANSISAILRAGPFWILLDFIGDAALIAATCLIVVKSSSDWFSKQG